MLPGGLAALFLALASPIEPFAALLLQAHMIQHLLFMMVAPPLFWLGAPLFPIVRGLPPAVRTYWVVPLLRSTTLRRLFARLTHPVVALPLFVAVTWLWHAPPVYEYALRSSGWHSLQHLCFLGSALLFWYPGRPAVSQPPALVALAPVPVPDPGGRAEHRPVGLADFLRPRAVSALCADPAAGRAVRLAGSVGGRRHHVGAWFPGLSVAPVRDRHPASLRRRDDRAKVDGEIRPSHRSWIDRVCRAKIDSDKSLSRFRSVPRPSFDVLRLADPVGRFLKWRHARFAMQLPLCGLAASDPGRPVRAAGRPDEPRRSPALDSLAGLVDPGLAGGGQLLLHGVPVHAAPDPGPPMAPRGPALAALAAQQMAGGGPARAVSVGVRGVLALGQPVVDGLDRDRLFRPGVCHRRLLPRRRRSASISVPSASSTSCSRWFRRCK